MVRNGTAPSGIAARHGSSNPTVPCLMRLPEVRHFLLFGRERHRCTVHAYDPSVHRTGRYLPPGSGGVLLVLLIVYVLPVENGKDGRKKEVSQTPPHPKKMQQNRLSIATLWVVWHGGIHEVLAIRCVLVVRLVQGLLHLLPTRTKKKRYYNRSCSVLVFAPRECLSRVELQLHRIGCTPTSPCRHHQNHTRASHSLFLFHFGLKSRVRRPGKKRKKEKKEQQIRVCMKVKAPCTSRCNPPAVFPLLYTLFAWQSSRCNRCLKHRFLECGSFLFVSSSDGVR